MGTYIKRDLPNDEYQAAVGANNASASNVFATIADLTSGITDADALVVDVKINQAGGILKGQAVYVNGADGTNILVGKADYSTEATSSKTLGLLITSAANNGFSKVITQGSLKGTGSNPLDTSVANAGDPVWLGDDGNLIYGLVNKPYAPNHLVFIGIVVEANPTVGEIYVKVQNGFELDEIHNVDIKSNPPVDQDVLTYDNASGLWINKALPATVGAAINPSLEPVIENTLTDPLFLNPEFGDSYLVPVGATGAWLGQDNNVATWDGSAWVYYTPVSGDITTVLTGANAGNVYQFSGTVWNVTATTSVTATPFYLAGSSVDAGGNKISNIARAGRLTLGLNSGPLFNSALTVRGRSVLENTITRTSYCATSNPLLVNTWYRVALIAVNNTRYGSFKILFTESISSTDNGFSAIIDIKADKIAAGRVVAKVTVISQTEGYTLTEDNFKIYRNTFPALGPLTVGIYYRPTVANAFSTFTVLNGYLSDTQPGITWYNTNLGATITDTINDFTNKANIIQYGIKNNYSAIVDPTVNDDSSLNYWVGSKWINTATGKSFVCTNSTASAAVWKQTSNENNTSGSPYLNNVVLVNSVSDLPSPSGGTITLATNTVYRFNTGTFNIGTNYLTISDGTVIEGQSSFNTSIVYTGAGGALRGTDVNFAARQIAFASPAGRVLDFTNVAQTKNISLQNCAVSSQTSASVITGYNIIFMAQTRFIACVGGINLINNLGVAFEFVVFNNTNSGTYITLTPTASTTAKFSDCDFVVDGVNTALNVTSTTILSGIIASCDFKGTAPVANRLTGVNGNTAGWTITYGTNIGIAGLQFVDIEIAANTNAALGNAAGTYIDTGVKGYAIPIASYDSLATTMEAKITALMTNAITVQSGVYDVTAGAIVGGLGTGVSGTDVAVMSDYVAITPNKEYTGYYVKGIGAATRKSIKLTLKIY